MCLDDYCMKFATFDYLLQGNRSADALDLFSKCLNCARRMAAVPQGMLMAIKARERKETRPDLGQNQNYDMTTNPLHYNSKLMNSIWGLYNKYSVHNLKKNYDASVNSIQNIGTTTVNTTSTNTPVFTNPWNFGNSY